MLNLQKSQPRGLSRSVLKWIALITMLIDHIGAVIGYTTFEAWNLGWLYLTLRTIGRISFPLFAFFIAEGWYYTRNRKRYALTLLAFAIISQPIYYFALNENLFDLNILFTFLFAFAVFYIIDQIKKDKSMLLVYATLIIAIFVLIFVLTGLGITVSYGFYGVLLPTVFYLFNHMQPSIKTNIKNLSITNEEITENSKETHLLSNTQNSSKASNALFSDKATENLKNTEKSEKIDEKSQKIPLLAQNFNIYKVIMWIIAAVLMVVYWLESFLFSDMNLFMYYYPLFALLALPLLMLYNGQKGKNSPKWLFYIFYPAHLLIIYLFVLLLL